jgi:hypothetical protein
MVFARVILRKVKAIITGVLVTAILIVDSVVVIIMSTAPKIKLIVTHVSIFSDTAKTLEV